MIYNIRLYFLIAFFALLTSVTSPSLGQCLDPNQQLLPDKDLDSFNSYGYQLDSYEDYLIVSEVHNDSLEYNCGIVFLYKLNQSTNQWERKASLAPSTPNLKMFFGRQIAIHDNMVVITGNTYTSEGFHYDELFIYTKDPSEEWSDMTESQRVILEPEKPGSGMYTNHIEISDSLIVVSLYTTDRNKVNIYQYDALKNINLLKQIQAPSESSNFGYDFDFNNEIIAISDNEYRREGTLRGLAFIYRWEEVLNQSSPLPHAHLEPSNILHSFFGEQIEINNDEIFISNGYSNVIPADYPTNIFIYNRPENGWTDASETTILSTNTSYYPGHSNRMEVTDSTIFLSRKNNVDNRIYLFRKGENWSSTTPVEGVINTYNEPNDTRVFGRDIAKSQDHLLVSFGETYIDKFIKKEDLIIDYFHEDGYFEDISTPNQTISESLLSASDDLFGSVVKAADNTVVISAVGDNDYGENAGAVYIFDKNESGEFEKTKKITPHNGRGYDNFGSAIELSDSILFVSSGSFDSLNTDGSSAFSNIGKVDIYIKRNNNWSFLQEIFSPEVIKGQGFGRSLSYFNGYLAVGEYDSHSSESNGFIQIYKNDNGLFSHIATLQSSDQQGGDFFGRQVIMNDSLIFVGTGNREYSIYDEMKIYIFKKHEEWENSVEEAVLVPTTEDRYDLFGFSIDVYNDLVVVGAPYGSYSEIDNNGGLAYLFKMPESGWSGRITESLILEPEEKIENNLFGYSVFINDGHLLIGAASSINTQNSVWISDGLEDMENGKIYSFDLGALSNQSLHKIHEDYIITSPNSRFLDGFGYSIDANDSTLFIGAIYDNNETGFRAGGVYTMNINNFILTLNAPLCVDDSPLILNANLPGGLWEGDGISDQLTGEFTPSLAGIGWHTVSYTVNSCKTSKRIFVGAPPIISNSSPLQNIICDGSLLELFVDYSSSDASISWEFKAKSETSFTTLPFTSKRIDVSKEGIYRVSVDNKFCDAVSIEFELKFEDRKGELDIDDTKICPGESATLSLITDNPIKSQNWYFAENLSKSFMAIFSASSITTGAPGYYFTKFNTELCSYFSDTVAIELIEVDVKINDAPTLCSNTPYQMTASPGMGQWSGPSISHDGIVSTSSLENGAYNYTYQIDKSGCTFQTTTEVRVELLLKPQIQSSDVFTCQDDPVTLTAKNTDVTTLTWMEASKNQIVGDGYNTTINTPGDYYLIASKNGCQQLSDTINIAYYPDSLFVPNIATVNNDFKNDEFRILSDGLSEFQLTISNRWGKEVYRSHNKSFKWNGSNVGAGVYFWYINYKTCNNETKHAKGTLHLVK